VFFFLLFVGSNFVFFPLHYCGLYAFPRRISDYPFCFMFITFITVFWFVVFVFFYFCLLLFVFCFLFC